MTATLTWICHASTSAARSAAFPGDEPVDAIGERDCSAVRLPRTAERVWVGPELRTLRTAELLGLAASIEPTLRDCDHGRWQGCALADIAAAEPEGLQAWLNDPDAAPHGGESLRAIYERVAGWMEIRQAESGRAIAVTHPNVLRMAVAHALGAGPEAARNIDVAPLGFAVTAFNGRWRLKSLGSLIRED